MAKAVFSVLLVDILNVANMSRTKDWWMETQYLDELLNKYKIEDYDVFRSKKND